MISLTAYVVAIFPVAWHSKAFSSYSEVALLKFLSNALSSFSASALFALDLNSLLLTVTQCFLPKSLGL